MQFEAVQLTLAGHRTENQDRVTVINGGDAALIAVVDGMGGHAEGARASELTIECLQECFNEAGQPVLDPQGFLIAALTEAHERVVALGEGIPVEHRPRATCAICLVQDDSAYCAHIGDSRIYHLRDTRVIERSRDHSHVELLLQEGVIAESDVKDHPMRNFVECCLGGDHPLPDMSIGGRIKLRHGDVVLVCSDGLWSGVADDRIASLADSEQPLEPSLKALMDSAIATNAPHSDNTSAAALRLNGSGK